MRQRGKGQWQHRRGVINGKCLSALDISYGANRDCHSEKEEVTYEHTPFRLYIFIAMASEAAGSSGHGRDI